MGMMAASGTACQNSIRISFTNGVESFPHLVRTGCAGGGHRQAGSLCLKPDCYIACCHIGDHHGNKKGRNPLWPLFQQLLQFSRHCDQPANAGSKIHPEPLWSHLPKNAAILYCLAGCGHGILAEQIAFAYLALFHISKRVKILDLGRYFCFVFTSVKPAQRANPVFAGQQVFPKGRDIIPHWRYRS